MSKVVKGVGRATGKVAKGVGNVVKKVASSKFGKILLTAATVYFGGAALMGGLSSSAAGGTRVGRDGLGNFAQSQSLGISKARIVSPFEICRCCNASRAAVPRGVTPTLVDWYI